MDQLAARLPYKVAPNFRPLGAFFDQNFSFQKQFEKVRVRMALVKRVSECTWGLETRLLKAAGDALLIGLLRYALAETGASVSEKTMNRIEPNKVNILARRVFGVNRTARLPILHALSGMISIRNLYPQRCALLLDLAIESKSKFYTNENEKMARRELRG